MFNIVGRDDTYDHGDDVCDDNYDDDHNNDNDDHDDDDHNDDDDAGRYSRHSTYPEHPWCP